MLITSLTIGTSPNVTGVLNANGASIVSNVIVTTCLVPATNDTLGGTFNKIQTI
ncbi:MAG: hypothetical protein IPI76_16860 [Chloracidobacterium sp.]|nr:hypothetical protein [Chloracidobacterium sp.]